ncbi:hypothetical protein ACFC01_33070 [Streptomyces mirabilis]|uniref:hypothetical protein n=1 Tax=Streptomyces TaxID=1883 RepID=UPI001C3073C9|nr:hypothetical protein [Streptomyces sp. GbtcB7]
MSFVTLGTVMVGIASVAGLVATGYATWVSAQASADALKQGKGQPVADPIPSWVGPAVLFGVMALAVAGISVYWLVSKARLKEAERERKILESAADRLREKMELPSLVDFNRVLLDRYHGIATDQATKAYNASRVAMGIGLAILVVAFFAGWQLNAQGDRLFVGSFAAVGTAFTAYLSRTYMQTYERALQQLNQYFNQPVLNGYFLTAERIASTLRDDRRAVVMEMIVGDILESGKEMHRNVTTGTSPQTTAPKPRRQRRTATAEAAIPTQQS